jgi:hypothetical protein
MSIAYYSYARLKRGESLPVVVTHTEEYLPNSILAVLVTGNPLNDAIIRSAIDGAKGRTIVFLYLGSRRAERTPNILEFHDPYYDNEIAKKTFGTAERLARESKVKRLYLYRHLEPHAIRRVWNTLRPYDTIIAADNASQIQETNPDRVRYEVTSEGKIVHLLKRW